ncbi:ABC transporter ATP-binding protein [Pollutibacter soli]|uniref:ABC transporter ATP-binding protein n=1 Tax=Pollutibacter soli TaxID=3034157 RepID=UPI0030132B64
MAILQIREVSKSYGRIQALNKVSIEVPEGSVFGILGPNGSGKTTLLSIILDVLAADSGSYNWFGEGSSPDIRKKIGSLLETPNFYHYLSAVNNLKITHEISGRGDAGPAIDSVLKQVKLFERRNTKFSTYSLGMKQRLAIAAALLGGPKVLVLDEPTNGLDPVGIIEIRQLITALRNQGHTIIIASHLLDEVEKICTHVAILKKGVLVTTGNVDEVLIDEDAVELSAADNSRLFELLREFAGIKNLSKENAFVYATFQKGGVNLEEVNRFCFNNGIILNHLLLKKQKLETRFFELTADVHENPL